MSWLSSYSPLRSFPGYSGPYPVGTCDIELPATSLESPGYRPSEAESIGTVSFRVFYPCETQTHNRPVRWVPTPQSRYVAAYARFMGANPTLADVVSVIPQLLYLTRIPCHRNAELLTPPTKSGRWPVLVFSHGLAGSRNAYSHLLGSLSSHGIVCFAIDHRDGSAPISFVRATSSTESKAVRYTKISHNPSQEVYDSRDSQLRIRLWELSLLHDAIVKIDLGTAPRNLDNNRERRKRVEVVDMFKERLDLHRPGSILWVGHSFGAATISQFVKSVYWRTGSGEKAEYEPLFAPHSASGLVKQITPQSTVVLLDLWCLPLRSPSTTWLWERPMPCYDATSAFAAGGGALLTVLSSQFANWEGNLNDTKEFLSSRGGLPSDLRNVPYAFYPESSAHLSHSDFGIVFPLLTGKLLRAKEPERYLKLNVRAILQVIRDREYEIADTSPEDLELTDSNKPVAVNSDSYTQSPSRQDSMILDPEADVRGWQPIAMEPVGGKHVEEDYGSAAEHDMDEAQVLKLNPVMASASASA